MAGSSVPDRLRPPLQHPARALADHLRDHAPDLVWRALHPTRREPFRGEAPAAVERLRWTTPDGWTGSIRYVPPRPGGSGEPVVLLHTLGLGPDCFRIGGARSFVGQLTAAGLGCYLPSLRGDREAEGPGAVDLDGVAEHDLPSILDAVAEHAGCRRVLVVGHGMGGLALVTSVARRGDERLAAAVALSVPVRFVALERAVRLGLAVASSVGVDVPMRAVARVAAVLGDPDGAVRGAGLRTALLEATEDIPVGLLNTLERWCAAGALVDASGTREYATALRQARAPLLVATAAGDTWAPPERAQPLASLWGGPADLLELPADLGHLDLLLHPDAAEHVVTPVAAWIARHRTSAWSSVRA